MGTTMYEEFEPATQVKTEDPENTILILHLPGFGKGQVRITYLESTRSIKVEGKRAAVSGKWIGFNKVFQVPPNCTKPDKIHARFQNALLTITIPNQPPAPVPLPLPTSATIQPVPTIIKPSPDRLNNGDHADNQKKEKNKKIDDDVKALADHLLNTNQDKILFQNPAAEKEKGSLRRRPRKNYGDDDQEPKRDVGVAAALGRRRLNLQANETTLLLNVGVAILVIATVGAIATYKIRSK